MTVVGPTGVIESEAFELPADFVPGADDKAPDLSVGTNTEHLCGKPGCPNEVTKPAKGPYSKYCDEHRGTRAARGTGGNRTSYTRKSWGRAGDVEKSLTTYVQLLGGAVTFVDAKDGTAVTKYGPAVVHEIVELAREDMRIRKYLELLSTPGKYGPLVFALASMALPILANHGLVPQIIVNLTALGGSENEQ